MEVVERGVSEVESTKKEKGRGKNTRRKSDFFEFWISRCGSGFGGHVENFGAKIFADNNYDMNYICMVYEKLTISVV